MNRREFSRRVKLDAWDRCGGHCEKCERKLQIGRFTYDHVIPCEMGGEPTLDNCQVICEFCDKPKTRQDQADIAKVRRVRAKHVGATKPKRGFRGWRRFDGIIVWRDDK